MAVRAVSPFQEWAMSVSTEFVEFICEQLAPLGRIEARSMMGGRTLYCDDVIFALIDDDQLYIKVNESTLPRFLDAGSSLFAPFKDQPAKTMKYARLPDNALDDREAMLAWAELGVEAGRRSPTRSKPRANSPARSRVAKVAKPTKKKASAKPVKRPVASAKKRKSK